MTLALTLPKGKGNNISLKPPNPFLEPKKVFFQYFCHSHMQVVQHLSSFKSEYARQKQSSACEPQTQLTGPSENATTGVENIPHIEQLIDTVNHFLSDAPAPFLSQSNFNPHLAHDITTMFDYHGKHPAKNGDCPETDEEWANRMLSIPALSTLLLTAVVPTTSLENRGHDQNEMKESNQPGFTHGTLPSSSLKSNSITRRGQCPSWWMWTKINRAALLSRASSHHRKTISYKEFPLSIKSRSQKKMVGSVVTEAHKMESESESSVLCRIPLISLVHPVSFHTSHNKKSEVKNFMSLDELMYSSEKDAFSAFLQTGNVSRIFPSNSSPSFWGLPFLE